MTPTAKTRVGPRSSSAKEVPDVKSEPTNWRLRAAIVEDRGTRAAGSVYRVHHRSRRPVAWNARDEERRCGFLGKARRRRTSGGEKT